MAPSPWTQTLAREGRAPRARAALGRSEGAAYVAVIGPLVVRCGRLGLVLDYASHCDSAVWMRDLDQNSVTSRKGMVAASFHSVRTDPGVPGAGSDSLWKSNGPAEAGPLDFFQWGY